MPYNTETQAKERMTYLRLLQLLQQLTPQQLNQDVRFWDMYQGQYRSLMDDDDLVVDDLLDDVIATLDT